jgi:3-hydroxyisobutyrate dehydrogenase
MGTHMAARLNALSQGESGRDALVWNRLRGDGTDDDTRGVSKKALDHESTCGTKAVSLAEFGESCDVMCFCLPTSADVAALLSSIPALKPGALVIDCTSGDPAELAEIEAHLGARGGVRLVDAPVSGGSAGAEAGSLASMMGGAAADVDAAVAVVCAWSPPDKITRCGPLGAGAATKAVNNAMMAANMLVAAEGVLALQRYGVQPSVALAVINSSSGGSKQSAVFACKALGKERFPFGGFTLGLLSKDCQVGGKVVNMQSAGRATLIPEAMRLMQEANALVCEGGVEEKDYYEAIRVIEARESLEARDV